MSPFFFLVNNKKEEKVGFSLNRRKKNPTRKKNSGWRHGVFFEKPKIPKKLRYCKRKPQKNLSASGHITLFSSSSPKIMEASPPPPPPGQIANTVSFLDDRAGVLLPPPRANSTADEPRAAAASYPASASPSPTLETAHPPLRNHTSDSPSASISSIIGLLRSSVERMGQQPQQQQHPAAPALTRQSVEKQLNEATDMLTKWNRETNTQLPFGPQSKFNLSIKSRPRWQPHNPQAHNPPPVGVVETAVAKPKATQPNKRRSLAKEGPQVVVKSSFIELGGVTILVPPKRYHKTPITVEQAWLRGELDNRACSQCQKGHTKCPHENGPRCTICIENGEECVYQLYTRQKPAVENEAQKIVELVNRERTRNLNQPLS